MCKLEVSMPREKWRVDHNGGSMMNHVIKRVGTEGGGAEGVLNLLTHGGQSAAAGL